MSRIIIFEGADGSGKTSLALKVAKRLGAMYVHFGPAPQIKKAEARRYIEGALPALLGLRDVVMDRSWLSEGPYGRAYRSGADRLGVGQTRMLERIFMRAETSVVLCDPGWTEVLKNWSSRREGEYLDHPEQLALVHAEYENLHEHTALPVYRHNYTNSEFPDDVGLLTATSEHEEFETAGALFAQTLIVGDTYPALTDYDTSFQKPFAAFSGAGCSKHVTMRLEELNIGEERLVWINADHLIRMSPDTFHSTFLRVKKVVALGPIAASACRELWVPHIETEHPQTMMKAGSWLSFDEAFR